MLRSSFRSALLALLAFGLVGLTASPNAAFAQDTDAPAQGNVRTIDGPNPGDETTMSVQPIPVSDDFSVRAIGVDQDGDARWALSVIGASAEDVSFSMAGETLQPLQVERPDGSGPLKVYLAQDAFRALAQTPSASITVGDTTASLPDALQADMKTIYETVL